MRQHYQIKQISLLVIAAGIFSGCSSDKTVPGASHDGYSQDSVEVQTDQDDTGNEDIFLFPDTAPDPGSFLSPCFKNDDCDSALCVDSPMGRVCTKTCTETCPTGFDCKEKKDGSGDVIFLCAPKYIYLCHPCSVSSSCNDSGGSENQCIPFGDNGEHGSFCGVVCNPAQPECPSSYSCQAVSGGHQCLPNSDECECNQKAISLSLETECATVKVLSSTNTAKCLGTRKCSASGLGSCSAMIPAIEKCDGIDNDCNGKTDDLDDSLKLECSSTNEFGTCLGTITSCKDGKTLCSAKAPKPESCNGLDDDCDSKTDEDLCDDGKVCTEDSCQGDTCKHLPASDLSCTDGSVCTQKDVCVEGNCVGGVNLDCDDKDPCSADSCDAFSGCKHTASSNAVCPDDGDVCTQDICKEGKCIHPQEKDGSPCVDDGNVCTSDICKGSFCIHVNADNLKCKDDGVQCTDDICKNSTCTHPLRTGKCEDGNPCTKNDICQGLKCIAGVWDQCDDNNPCTKGICDISKGCKYTANDFAVCKASSKECSVGQCQAGKCLSKVNESCDTIITVDKCGSIEASGSCSSGGVCSVKNSTKAVACTKTCNGLCFSCSGKEVCWTK